MNEKELCDRLGIVRVSDYWRRGVGGSGIYRVRPHYRAAPGLGPISEITEWEP